MNRINPFDISLNQGIQKTESANAPEKINQNNEQKEAQAAQGIGGLKPADENTMIDTSSMVDDTENFDISDSSNENKTGNSETIGKADESQQGNNGKNNNEDDKKELMANVEDMMNDFFNKKNPQE